MIERMKELMSERVMKRVIVISSLLLAISFTAVAQVFGATQGEEQNAFGASAPSATFQSTSSMSSSGSSYSATPSLNADGTAAYEGGSYSSAKAPLIVGPRRNPIVDENDEGNVPIGDVFWPLALLALAYLSLRVFLKRKRA